MSSFRACDQPIDSRYIPRGSSENRGCDVRCPPRKTPPDCNNFGGGNGREGGDSFKNTFSGRFPGFKYISSLFKNKKIVTRFGAAGCAAAVACAFAAVREKNKYENLEKNKAVTNETLIPVLLVDELRHIFLSGNTQHCYNSLAIMAVPWAANSPVLTTSLLLAGITIFSGTQYYRSFGRKPEKLKPLLLLGGSFLMAGWLSFLV